MCIHVYVCMYVCMYVYIYIYICTHTHTYVFMYMYMCTCYVMLYYIILYYITSYYTRGSRHVTDDTRLGATNFRSDPRSKNPHDCSSRGDESGDFLFLGEVRPLQQESAWVEPRSFSKLTPPAVDASVHIYIYIHIHTHLHVYMCIYIYIYIHTHV